MKVIVIPIATGALGTVTKVTRTEGLGNKRMSGDHPNYNAIEVGQNIEKSSGNPMKDYELMVV